MKYDTVQQLIAAYKSGDVTAPIVLDNDTTGAFIDAADAFEKVFTMGPEALLRSLLDHVGIPWEEC